MGDVSFMQLEAPAGRLCAVGSAPLVLVVVAEHTVNVGLIRVELLRSVAGLASIVAAEAS
jgi:predicted regulator of Ras-like GTPase activity (Roadblock/LC7/MglB family)